MGSSLMRSAIVSQDTNQNSLKTGMINIVLTRCCFLPTGPLTDGDALDDAELLLAHESTSRMGVAEASPSKATEFVRRRGGAGDC